LLDSKQKAPYFSGHFLVSQHTVVTPGVGDHKTGAFSDGSQYG
jgi:hypothetical protein